MPVVRLTHERCLLRVETRTGVVVAAAAVVTLGAVVV